MTDNFEEHCWKDVVSQEILNIYQAYKRETFIGQRPALLAIDLYNLAFAGGPQPVHEAIKENPSSCGIYAWNAIEPLKELFDIVRSKGIPVIYTTGETRREAKPRSVHATYRQKRTVAKDAYEIRDEFKPLPDDVIVYKQRASGFFGTPLIAHLTQLGIDSLIVCGESTSGCVRATVVDAYSYGFHTAMVEECCFDRSILSHKVNLFDLHHKYADVMHLEEVNEQLQSR